MDDEAMARLEGGLAAAVQAAAASKPNSKERKQQLLNFKFRCVIAFASGNMLACFAAAWYPPALRCLAICSTQLALRVPSGSYTQSFLGHTCGNEIGRLS